MKRRILLIDESLTVQKVVALTLDREKFQIAYAKTRSEAMKTILESPPECVLVSDSVSGLSSSTFPKEVEAWVGRDRRLPALILISSQEGREHRGYQAVLKKPFAPAALQAAVNEATQGSGHHDAAPAAEEEDARLQKIFSDTFSDEARLVSETLQSERDREDDTLLTIPAPAGRATKPGRENVAEFWSKPASDAKEVHVLGPEDSMAYKAQLEKEVSRQLESYDLEDVVHRLLEKLVPPIVEKLAQQRLDQLLKESESFVELKP